MNFTTITIHQTATNYCLKCDSKQCKERVKQEMLRSHAGTVGKIGRAAHQLVFTARCNA